MYRLIYDLEELEKSGFEFPDELLDPIRCEIEKLKTVESNLWEFRDRLRSGISDILSRKVVRLANVDVKTLIMNAPCVVGEILNEMAQLLCITPVSDASSFEFDTLVGRLQAELLDARIVVNEDENEWVSIECQMLCARQRMRD